MCVHTRSCVLQPFINGSGAMGNNLTHLMHLMGELIVYTCNLHADAYSQVIIIQYC